MSEVVGNDGLTDAEREEYAAQYLRTAGKRGISPAEKQAFDDWRARKAREQG